MKIIKTSYSVSELDMSSSTATTTSLLSWSHVVSSVMVLLSRFRLKKFGCFRLLSYIYLKGCWKYNLLGTSLSLGWSVCVIIA